MGARNFLIEGVSCTGKTTVCKELRRRGYAAVNGDADLAYQGEPATGLPTAGHLHEHHLWDLAKVSDLAADNDAAVTFFCGGSRNHAQFLHLFDAVFVLEIDADTLIRRLDERPHDEFGARAAERELVLRLHRTQEDVPDGIRIDATRPLAAVVDSILATAGVLSPHTSADA